MFERDEVKAEGWGREHVAAPPPELAVELAGGRRGRKNRGRR